MSFHPETDKGLILKVLEEATTPLTCEEVSRLLPREIPTKVISSSISSLRLMNYVRTAGEKPNLSLSKHGRRMVPTYELVRK